MVEAVGQNFGDLGLSPDGMSFGREQGESEPISAIDRGRKFLNEQLEGLKQLGPSETWKEAFAAQTKQLASEAGFVAVDVANKFMSSPFMSDPIDSLPDVYNAVIVFVGLPLAMKAVGFIKEKIANRREAA